MYTIYKYIMIYISVLNLFFKYRAVYKFSGLASVNLIIIICIVRCENLQIYSLTNINLSFIIYILHYSHHVILYTYYILLRLKKILTTKLNKICWKLCMK